MPLTPADVRHKQFSTTRLRPGYDEEEVDAFLDEVEVELDRLIKENEELRAKLAEVLRGGMSATAALSSPLTGAGPSSLVREQLPPEHPSSPYRAVGSPQESPSQRWASASYGRRSIHESPTTKREEVAAARSEGRRFGEFAANLEGVVWVRRVLESQPRLPADVEANLIQSASPAVSVPLEDDVRQALRSGFWDALETLAEVTGESASHESVVQAESGLSAQWLPLEDAPREDEVHHADGVLRRFNFGPSDLVLIDQAQGADTVNWTTHMTPRSFLRLAQEFLHTRRNVSAEISVAGQITEINASFLMAFVESASEHLDRSCDFVRFDAGDACIAFQVLPQVTPSATRFIGISSERLELALLMPIMLRTASPAIVEKALGLGGDSFVSRVATLLKGSSDEEESSGRIEE